LAGEFFLNNSYHGINGSHDYSFKEQRLTFSSLFATIAVLNDL
jgi:hypothetical protein